MLGLFGRMAATIGPPDRDATNDRYFGGDVTIGSVTVSAETAIRASAVFPVVSLIANIIGSLPLEFPRRDDTEGDGFPLADQLAYQPNPLTTGAEFWSTMAFNALLRGTAYAEPVVSSSGEIEVWSLRPVGIGEEHEERRFGVRYTYQDGRTRQFGPGELFRFSGISADGVSAVVPWKVAKTAIEMANVLEKFGETFFKNGARPSFVLSTERGLGGEQIERLKNDFNGNFAGYLNAGKVPILEEGLAPKPISSANTDNQYLELRRNQVREIARNWHLPMYMIGEGENAKSSEQQALDFVKYTVRPWTRRTEQAIARDLMTPEQRATWKPKFNLDALLRGDSATQWRNAVLARTAGAMAVDELRTKWFNLPAFDEDWSKDPRAPLNSNRAADTASGGMTAPQDRSDA